MEKAKPNKMTQAQIIRARIEALMRANRIKYGMLAVIIEKCPQTVSKRMNEPETFTVEELIKVCRFFKVTMKELCGGEV